MLKTILMALSLTPVAFASPALSDLSVAQAQVGPSGTLVFYDLSDNPATAPTILYTPWFIGGLYENLFHVRNLSYPSSSTLLSLDVRFHWETGSSGRTLDLWNGHIGMGVNMISPSGFYTPTLIDLRLTVRDAEGVIVDSTSGNYFYLVQEAPEPALGFGVLAAVALIAIYRYRVMNA